ncbi:hypothetical protein [Jiangella alba]|uniref:Uncharacterized protein n=1 Tax=Jiangella alba TaxID=561176 RepID=A0A1H5MYS2_9ACTN|nr:hypothetical protein [Jiangella alba]SEE94320.1 hypothetical protein SAMN04488561_3542 [Jiangella alba]
MTTTTPPQECVLKWCNEAGEHRTHRQYVTSVVAGRDRWLLGVNLVGSEAGHDQVELTAAPRCGPSVVLELRPDEAEAIGASLVEAAARQVSASV